MNKVLNEASLSRVWQHFSDPEKQVAVLTAFRSEYDYDENIQRNRTLAAELKNLGYGYFFVDGYWVENPGTENEQRVKEDSIFVIAPATKTDFVKNIHELGNKYSQEAVLVKSKNGPELIFADGSTQKLGDLQPGKMAQAYTKIRNNKRSNTFVFESERDDIGWLKRLAGLSRE